VFGERAFITANCVAEMEDEFEKHNNPQEVMIKEDVDDTGGTLDAGVEVLLSSPRPSSPSSCSYYSTCTRQEGSEVDTMSSYSFYSTATIRETDTDGASYCSADTMVGDSDMEEDERERVDVTMIGDTGVSIVQPMAIRIQDSESLSRIRGEEWGHTAVQEEGSHGVHDHGGHDHGHGHGGHGHGGHGHGGHGPLLAGSCVSDSTGISPSMVSEGVVSLAGQVNERLGRLLGYQEEGGQAGRVLGQQEAGNDVDVDAAVAQIIGYEIVKTRKDIYTVYKIHISYPSSAFEDWFIQRRYSDFLRLRTTLMKDCPSKESELPFPPKRWVGSNLEPTFLGRRLAGLQFFLATVMEEKELRQSPAVQAFLCVSRPLSGQTYPQENKVICDTLDEAIKELRKQLRKKEKLEMELNYHKQMTWEKEQQIQNLLAENMMLRKQKEKLESNSISSERERENNWGGTE